MKIRPFLHILVVGLIIGTFSSCVDIFDELIVHPNGTGTFKYTVNLSASKIKINSILALDSVDGRRIPKLPEIKERLAIYLKNLEGKDGVSNVKLEANYVDFIFKFSCDFENVSKLQTAIKEVIKEEVKDKNDPLFSETWFTFDGKSLVRSIPNISAPLHKLKAEDQEALKNGKYIAVTRFDTEISRCDNVKSVISPSKKAVKMEGSTHAIALNPSLIKGTIFISQ